MTTRCTCGAGETDHPWFDGGRGMACGSFTPESNISEPRMSLDLEAHRKFARERYADNMATAQPDSVVYTLSNSVMQLVERVKTLEAPRASYEVFCWNCAERNVGVVCKRCDSRLDAEARVKALEADNRTLEVSASDYATVLKRSQKRAREAEARVKELEAALERVLTDIDRGRSWFTQDGCGKTPRAEGHEGCWWCPLLEGGDEARRVLLGVEV